MSPTTPLHRAAATGFAQGADDYARGRPGYPPPLVGWLQQDLGLQAGKTALDLGAGTGKFLPTLLATGAEVTAVEPVAAMRTRLSTDFPQVTTLEGNAESIPLPTASLDAVVCATAFHWFATPRALDEILRVLKPGGRLGLVWNVRDERVGWVTRLARIVNAYEDDTPRQASDAWRKVFPYAGFGPLQRSEFDHTHRGTPGDVIVKRVLSTSFIAALPAPQRAEVAHQVRELIDAEPELAGEPEVEMPYRCTAYVTTKLA